MPKRPAFRVGHHLRRPKTVYRRCANRWLLRRNRFEVGLELVEDRLRLVAADPKVLPYGTMLTVPGYADGEIVPVLDCGGAIKGARLDLLFPTHEGALNWGVQDLRVVVWEYADGQPAPNPRRVR